MNYKNLVLYERGNNGRLLKIYVNMIKLVDFLHI